jgi:hypothetical protein
MKNTEDNMYNVLLRVMVYLGSVLVILGLLLVCTNSAKAQNVYSTPITVVEAPASDAVELFTYAAEQRGIIVTKYSNRQFQTTDGPALGAFVGLVYDGSSEQNLEILRSLIERSKRLSTIESGIHTTDTTIVPSAPVKMGEDAMGVYELVERATAQVNHKYDSLIERIAFIVEHAFDSVMVFPTPTIDTVSVIVEVPVMASVDYNTLHEGDTISCIKWRTLHGAAIPRELHIYKNGAWHQINPSDLEINASLINLRKMNGSLGKHAFIIQDVGGYQCSPKPKPMKIGGGLSRFIDNVKFWITPQCKWNKKRTS